VKFRNKEQYIKTHPHHLHPNQTHGMQTQIRKKKKWKRRRETFFIIPSWTALVHIWNFLHFNKLGCLSMLSVSITTNIIRLNPANGEVYAVTNTGITSIIIFTILEIPVFVTLYNTRNTSIVMLQYRKSSIVLPRCVLQYKYYQYCWMKNTRFSSIVCFTILVLPVLLDEEYWSFRYCV
jgi:hypothetical protein